jgi:hypothetical protein
MCFASWRQQHGVTDLINVRLQDENQIPSLVLRSDEAQARAYCRCEFAKEFEFGGLSSPIAD